MQGTIVSDMNVHSRDNCYLLSPEEMERLQSHVGVSTELIPGRTVIKIQSGGFGYRVDGTEQQEPWVLLWIYGGKVMNQQTKVEVEATWVSLNGYDDALTLDVRETCTLCAFFLDTFRQDNVGEVTLSITHL
jgi:hypothetical protein